VGFVVDKAELGQVFSENFGFPFHSFHRLLHTHHHTGLVQQASSLSNSELDYTPSEGKQKRRKERNK
jgi:hypothetical protein